MKLQTSLLALSIALAACNAGPAGNNGTANDTADADGRVLLGS